MSAPTLATVRRRLGRGEIVRLAEAQWQALAASFPVAATHDTGLAGPLLIVRDDASWAAVECPRPGERVIRPLADGAAGRNFVRERLAAYERMWDG